MKRLAALAPDLDIFGSHYVLRDGAGWQLTDAGHAFLAAIEMPAPATSGQIESPEVVVTLTPLLRLVADNQHTRRRARESDHPSNRSAVA